MNKETEKKREELYRLMKEYEKINAYQKGMRETRKIYKNAISEAFEKYDKALLEHFTKTLIETIIIRNAMQNKEHKKHLNGKIDGIKEILRDLGMREDQLAEHY